MRTLVVTENISLDGVIDLAQGWFDPLNEDVDQSDITAANSAYLNAVDKYVVSGESHKQRRIIHAHMHRETCRGA